MRKKYQTPAQVICDKAIIFARVSSKRQKEEGVSLDVQMEAITKYCHDKKLKIKPTKYTNNTKEIKTI